MDISVEIRTCLIAERIGGDPGAEAGVVVASAEVDEAGFFVSFGSVTPGVGKAGEGEGVAKAAVEVVARDFASRVDEKGDVAKEIVKGSVGATLQLDGDSGADFGMGSQTEDA